MENVRSAYNKGWKATQHRLRKMTRRLHSSPLPQHEPSTSGYPSTSTPLTAVAAPTPADPPPYPDSNWPSNAKSDIDDEVIGNPHSPPPPRDETRENKRRPSLLPSLTIAVMGATGSGKTSFINLASGSTLRVGMGLESCTTEVKLSNEFILDGRAVALIDTPGFDDTSKSDTEILEMIAAFLATSYEEGSKLSGVIYIHRISDYRFTGIAGRNFGMFRELCGDTTLENVVLVTNMWGAVSHDISEAREKELSGNFFKPVLKKGAQMTRHQNTAESAHNIIRMIMANRPVVLQIQRELVDEDKNIVDTAAGVAVNRELNEQARRHRDELEKVEKAMMRALERKDEETRKELEEEAAKLQNQMKKIEKDSKEMASSYATEKRRMEDKMREMEREVERERQQADAKLADLSRRLQHATDASAADRMRLEQEVKRERQRADDKLADLNRRLQDETNTSAADRVKLEQEVKRERQRAEEKLADLNRRLQDATDAFSADRARLEEIRQQQVDSVSREMKRELAEERRKMQERATKIEEDLAAKYAEEKARMEARTAEIEQGAKKERERAEADHKKQLAGLNRRLQDMVNTSAADQAKLEQEASEEKRRAEDKMADLDRRLRDATNASAADRARLKKERQQAEDKLADLNRLLRDATNASAAEQGRLKQQIKELQDRVTTSVMVSPHPTPRGIPSPPPSRYRPNTDRHRPGPAPTLTIAVIGTTGSGKTTFVNLASGSDLQTGDDLESCTSEVQLANRFTLDGRTIALIDTPGFDDTSRSDVDVLKMIAAFLADTYENRFQLSGIIYIHRISDKRFTGVGGRSLRVFRKLCGDETLKNVILVTNMWREVTPEVGTQREEHLSARFFEPALGLKAEMVRHDNTVESSHNIIRRILNNDPLALAIQVELMDEGKSIIETAAGEEVSRELNEQRNRHRAELGLIREEMMQALRYKDEEMRHELEEERRKMQAQLDKIKGFT